MQTFTTLNTDGKGYWSNTAKAVDVTKLQLQYINDERSFGELCVYFVNDSEEMGANYWDVDTMGLIYTDKQFMQELREYLVSLGFTQAEANSVSYSEQGMQDEEYVSCDVGAAFIAGLTRLDPAHVEDVYALCV
jgi:hypothetical protein